METITWNEYKARSASKNGFCLTHYSALFNNAFCMVNIEQNIGTLTHKLGYDTRYFTKEWNNQVNQVADRHMDHYVEITAEVVEVIKTKLEGYKKALNKALEWLATGLSGYDYNQAINDKTFNSMMVEKYEMILSLCPSFDDKKDQGENMEKIINSMQANEMLTNVLNEQGIKCYTFDLYANYSNDLSSIYYNDFMVEWQGKIIKHDHYIVFFASEDIKNAPYYKISHLRKMSKQALFDLCEQHGILNYNHSCYDYADNTKDNLINEIMQYVDNEKYYNDHYNETRYHDLDYDFSIHGYCQGDEMKIKLVGSEKDFIKHAYLPTSDYLTHIFYDSPIDGHITVLCNDEIITDLNFNEVDHFNEYDYWNKSDFIEKVKNTKWISGKEYFNLLIEYLEIALPSSLEYDY